MRRAFVFLVAVLFATSAGAANLVFPGVGHDQRWRTHFYGLADLSGVPTPAYVTLTYIPKRRDSSRVWSTQFELVSGDPFIWWNLRSAIGNYFPQTVGMSGTLVLSADFPVVAWEHVETVDGFGSSIPPAEELDPQEVYVAFGNMTESGPDRPYRYNCFFYYGLADPEQPGTILVDTTYYAIPPNSTILVEGLDGMTRIQAFQFYTYATCSQIHNRTDDPCIIPLVNYDSLEFHTFNEDAVDDPPWGQP